MKYFTTNRHAFTAKKQYLVILLVFLLAACGSQKPLSEAQYTQAIRKELPFHTMGFRQVNPELFSFRCDKYIDMLPDYEIDSEGVSFIWRTTFVHAHAKQPEQYIWRNIVIDRKHRRILCIDRVLRHGKTLGNVYVLQGETKQTPDGYQWDVTDQRLLMSVAPVLEAQTSLSIELLKAAYSK